jgi:hypothetical protein
MYQFDLSLAGPEERDTYVQVSLKKVLRGSCEEDMESGRRKVYSTTSAA